jgi:glutamate-ammonia-ligase adenylyltransferase
MFVWLVDPQVPMSVSLETPLADAPYVADLHARQGGWLDAAGTPDAALAAALRDVADAGGSAEGDEIGPALRLAKERVALLSAVAEVTGRWTAAQSTAAL